MGGMITLMYSLCSENLQGQVFTGAASSELPYIQGKAPRILLKKVMNIFRARCFNIVKDDVCSDQK